MRFIQFRDYDCATSFLLVNSSDEVVSAICNLMRLTGKYPYTLYFDVEVSHIFFNRASTDDIFNFYTDIQSELGYMEYDKPDEIRKYLGVIGNFYGFGE
jgi:hypothetical protein